MAVNMLVIAYYFSDLYENNIRGMGWVSKECFDCMFADLWNYLDVFNRPQIPGNTTWCFEYVMKRWYPVANLTRVRMATIYEQYQPGKNKLIDMKIIISLLLKNM